MLEYDNKDNSGIIANKTTIHWSSNDKGVSTQK